MPKKIWMRRVGFVRERQWLTLCSICFLPERNAALEALASAVLALGQVVGYAATATGQVLPGVAIGNEC